MPSVIAPTSKHGGAPLAAWRKDVVPTVIAMAAEMGPEELTARAVAQRMGLQDAQIWRALPRGRSDILFLVAGKLQVRQLEAVAHHDGLRKRTARGRVEAHLASSSTSSQRSCRGAGPVRPSPGIGPVSSIPGFGAG